MMFSDVSLDEMFPRAHAVMRAATSHTQNRKRLSA